MDTWVSESLSDDGQRAFFKAAQARQEASERDRRAVNRLGYVVGISGMVGGLIALAAALTVVAKLPPVQPQKYVLVDKTSGAIVPATDVKDAPLLYPEATRRAEIRALIVACEGYVPQSWAKVDFHNCMIRLTPGEQKRRNLDIGVDGGRYPPKAFGAVGYAMPTDFPMGAFVLLGSSGTPPNEVFHYSVRYERTEVIAGVEQHARYTADVVFTFRPDLKINGADALVNPARMQVESFSTIKDRT
jgi:type IV secretory pathway component VirB8